MQNMSDNALEASSQATKAGVCEPRFTMKIDNNRNCLLTVRLTYKEYELVKSVSAQQGARSIAEFARRAVLYQVTREGEGNVSVTDDLVTLTVRLRDLDAALKEAGARISRLLGTENRDESQKSEPGS